MNLKYPNIIRPEISVIIPVYNASKYLGRCLDYIINQTFQDIEIIAVDDCSTDNSLEILNQYAAKDDRIKVIHHEKNGGESKARNTGFDNAKSKYVAFVDNDDVLDLDFYEKIYKKIEEEHVDIARLIDFDKAKIFYKLRSKIHA